VVSNLCWPYDASLVRPDALKDIYITKLYFSVSLFSRVL
jgi:hypothetical protein